MSRRSDKVHAALLLLYSASFLVVMGTLARAKRLWFDELITVYLARLPDSAALWNALRSATDNNPPLYHLAARAATSVLGESALAVRLPSLLGFWLLTLCVYRFVARRCGLDYAWIALLTPLATAAAP